MAVMFDGVEYVSIRKGPDHRAFGELPEYQLVEYLFKKDVGFPPKWLRDDALGLTQWADLVIAYVTEPTFEYIFEMIDVDVELPVVGEIINWCSENLEEWNWLTGTVIKSRAGFPRSYLIFETPNEEDAVAFKLRWL